MKDRQKEKSREREKERETGRYKKREKIETVGKEEKEICDREPMRKRES